MSRGLPAARCRWCLLLYKPKEAPREPDRSVRRGRTPQLSPVCLPRRGRRSGRISRFPERGRPPALPSLRAFSPMRARSRVSSDPRQSPLFRSTGGNIPYDGILYKGGLNDFRYRCSIRTSLHLFRKYSAARRRWQRSGSASLHKRHAPSSVSASRRESARRESISSRYVRSNSLQSPPFFLYLSMISCVGARCGA